MVSSFVTTTKSTLLPCVTSDGSARWIWITGGVVSYPISKTSEGEMRPFTDLHLISISSSSPSPRCGKRVLKLLILNVWELTSVKLLTCATSCSKLNAAPENPLHLHSAL